MNRENKKLIIAITILLMFASLLTASVKAAGDKVRGEKAEGDANQVCNSLYEGDECPYGDYDPFE